MGCRNPVGGWFGAALIGAAAAVSTPLLFGGGGDEGVDILPRLDGGGRASGSDGLGGLDPATRGPVVGYVAVHGKTTIIDANYVAVGTGLRLHQHVRADLFLGLPGAEPDDLASTSLDLLTKGNRKLFYGEYVPSYGSIGGTPYLNLNGRFEIEDFTPGDGERLELSVRDRSAGAWTILIGKRASRLGSIGPSFTRIDTTLTGVEPSGKIDLETLRSDLLADWAGTGVDIAIVLSCPTPRGVDEAWAAFNADDSRRIWDVEIRTP